jgi:flagellar biosynthesis protein FliP
VLFGFRAFVFIVVLTGLFVMGLVRRSPAVWIMFGLAAVLALVLLFHGYEQIYKDGESA